MEDRDSKVESDVVELCRPIITNENIGLKEKKILLH